MNNALYPALPVNSPCITYGNTKKKHSCILFCRSSYNSNISASGGRIGAQGFEKMAAEERTFWGRIKAKVQALLNRFLKTLGLGNVTLTDKDFAYILFKSYQNLKNGGKPNVMDVAEDIAMRQKTGYSFKCYQMKIQSTITAIFYSEYEHEKQIDYLCGWNVFRKPDAQKPSLLGLCHGEEKVGIYTKLNG